MSVKKQQRSRSSNQSSLIIIIWSQGSIDHPPRPNSNSLPCSRCASPRVAHIVGWRGHDVLRICCVGIPNQQRMLRLQLVCSSLRPSAIHIRESTSATSCSSTIRAMFRLSYLLACAVCLLSAIRSAQSQTERKSGSPSKASRAIWAVVNDVVPASGPSSSTRTTSCMTTARQVRFSALILARQG